MAVRQLTWFAAGLVVMLAMLSFDYRRLERHAYLIYLVVLLLVLAVPLIGQVGGGSRRWIRLGPVSIQPSEFVKLAMVLVCARHFSLTPPAKLGLREAVVPLLLTCRAGRGDPGAARPRLGGADRPRARSRCWSSAACSCAGSRCSRRRSSCSRRSCGRGSRSTSSGASSPSSTRAQDPLGAGYHVIQSKIAVGSGMLWGKGFLQGTQNHLSFLPEQHTDFIFSVFSEEWGLAGAAILMALYLALLLRGAVIAARARNRFGALLVHGRADDRLLAGRRERRDGHRAHARGRHPAPDVQLRRVVDAVCLLIGIGLVMNVVDARLFSLR